MENDRSFDRFISLKMESPMSAEKLKEVEKMIAKVMKHKDCARAAAIDYMLIVATGRLLALRRYEDTLPEGKATKGVLSLAGRKKRAPKSPKIAPTVAAPVAASSRQVELPHHGASRRPGS